ncbi:CHC2 zinc finger domain-containing protein [Nocardia sp. NPDC059246]|uniref:CHC2 zinc finger domain-containing protein n=1 Tax=unclassified Nocardia TaxID=2637762 RepID=UPI0036C7E0F3
MRFVSDAISESGVSKIARSAYGRRLTIWRKPVGIREVVSHYYPEWKPPKDSGREWLRTLCPFHGESNASASISYEHNAFICRACGVKGDVYSIIMREEGVGFAEAKRLAAELSVDSGKPIRGNTRRKPGRRVFGQPGTSSRDASVRSGVRGRTSPWS